MSFAHPELLVPSIVALLCAVYPAPWHVRNRNIATLGMIFWMSSLNIVHIVNSIIWVADAQDRAPVWADISNIITMMYNYGLPLSHLILSRQLESCTSLRTDSPLYDSPSRHRAYILDLTLATAGPVVGFLVSLSCRGGRYTLIEAYGPMPNVYWDTWGVVWVAILPIIIAFMCFGYTCKACYNIIRRRQQMLSMISKNATLDKSHFVRLLVLAIAELGTCMLRAIFNMTWGTQGLDRLRFDNPGKSLTAVRVLRLVDLGTRERLVYNLSWFTVVACSIVFFLCFATSVETKKFYWGLLERVVPALLRYRQRKEREEDDKVKFNSYTTSGGSRGFNALDSGFDTQKDISLVDVASPRSLYKHETQDDDNVGEVIKARDVESAVPVQTKVGDKAV